MNTTTATKLKKIGIGAAIFLLILIGYQLIAPKPPLQQSKQEEIKIGYIGPLTGEAGSIGEAGIGGAQLAIQEINNAGGVLGKKLKLVPEDDFCTGEGGAKAMHKLVNVDKVVAITGPDCSVSAESALPIAQQVGVPTVIRWASASGLTDVGSYIFRIHPSDALQGKFIAEFIFNRLQRRTVAMIYVQNAWGTGIKDTFTKRFGELGGEVVYTSGITQESRDMRTELVKIKNTRAEILFLPIYFANATAALKQAYEVGITVPIVGGDTFTADEVQQAVGSEGVLYSVAKLDNPEEFQTKVFAATATKGDKLAAPLAYDSIYIIAEAIEKLKK